MRFPSILLGLMLLTAAAPAHDWTTATRQAANGAYVVGNPAARVRLVEYGSYTCPHCAAFAIESQATLKGQMIRSGSVSLEYRHLLRDQMDLGAAILVRCFGAPGFARASAAVFATQAIWMPRYLDWAGNHPEVGSLPPLRQARAYADASGLTALMERRGLTPARIAACFANRAAVDAITKLSGDTPIEVPGTPTFYLNGTMVPNVASWAALEPVLRAQGAK